MTYEHFPRSGVIDTPFGQLQAWSTSPEHIGFSEPTDERGSTTYDGNGHKVATMTFNRISHYVRVDMHPDAYFLTPEGHRKGMTWGKNGWATDYHYSVRKAIPFNLDDASASVNRQVQEKLIPFLADWIVSDEGQDLLARSTKRFNRERLEGARATVEKLRGDLATAEARLAALEAEGDG